MRGNSSEFQKLMASPACFDVRFSIGICAGLSRHQKSEMTIHIYIYIHIFLNITFPPAMVLQIANLGL